MSHLIKLENTAVSGESGVDTIQYKYGGSAGSEEDKSKIVFSSNGNITFHTNTAGNNNALFLKNDGNVGIGTTTPTEKLHVVGNAKMNSLTVTEVTNTSDRRLKTNIKAIDEFNLDDLRPVKYNWRKRKGVVRTDKECFGFIAQELDKIYPNVVKRSKRGLLSVDYIQLIPISIKNIQILEKRIQLLNETVEGLKSKIDNLS